MRIAALGFQTIAAIVIAVTAVNTALGGSLTSAVTGGAVAITNALLAISCAIQAREPRAADLTFDADFCDAHHGGTHA